MDVWLCDRQCCRARVGHDVTLLIRSNESGRGKQREKLSKERERVKEKKREILLFTVLLLLRLHVFAMSAVVGLVVERRRSEGVCGG